MKIESKLKEFQIKFNELKMGDVFEDNGKVYMKIASCPADPERNAVELTTGKTFFFGGGCRVFRKTMKLVEDFNP